MKLAILQLNYIVGDLDYNADKIISAVRSLNGVADLCVTSELALLGYPPKDLLLHEAFISESLKKLQSIATALKDGPALLIGRVVPNKSGVGKPLYNAATLIEKGEIKQDFYKTLIPTYDVFDEDRYFEPGHELNFLHFNGKKFGVTICEDVWNNENVWQFPRYAINPIEKLVIQKIDGIINLSASPYFIKKQASVRIPLMCEWAKKYNVPFFYANQVGGNDDLVFDGNSFMIDCDGNLVAKAKSFEEDVLVIDINNKGVDCKFEDSCAEEEVFNALVCGTKDYINKCGFKKAVLGLSGGIDSALTLAIAVEALGKENVLGVLMPSPYSSAGSVDDAVKLAHNLGVKTFTLPISEAMKAYDGILSEAFEGTSADTTEENLQARIRGNLLMALSNKFNALLLTTGNKSELSVGYCTIYGDMCGGLAVISDVYKTLVYRIAKWINIFNKHEIIPEATITKAPSAELRPDQTDQDSLPPYDELDDILYRYIELQQSAGQIVAAGHAEEVVAKILNLVTKAEFKRRQAAPGLKITTRAYGTGWRMPTAAKFKQLFSASQENAEQQEAIMRISVIGLGKLGACTAACFAVKGYEVVGVDINSDFVNAINQGKAPVYEPRLQDLITASHGRFSATQNYAEAIQKSNITLLIVPTPSREDGHFSDLYLQDALKPLSIALKDKNEFHTFVITSTVSPGTINKKLIPLIEKYSNKKLNKDFGIAYNPEFIALGSVITDFLNPDMVLIGESSERVGQQLEEMYRVVCETKPYIARMSLISAEIAKISLNSYVTMKISFANTLASLCEEIEGANVDDITAALGADKRIAPYYLKGGLGFGGPCFPRDNRAFAAFGAEYNIDAKLAKATDGTNHIQNERLCNHIKAICEKNNVNKVAIIGLSYKPSTPVIEESPAVKLISSLIRSNIKVVAYDPLAIENAKDYFGNTINYASSVKECFLSASVCIFMTADAAWSSVDSSYCIHQPTVIVDCWRIFNHDHFGKAAHYIRLGEYHTDCSETEREEVLVDESVA